MGKMKEVFIEARKMAKAEGGCIIFFDEIDSLAGKRGQDQGSKVTERVLNQLLAEMDGLEDLNDILIIGATDLSTNATQFYKNDGNSNNWIKIKTYNFIS